MFIKSRSSKLSDSAKKQPKEGLVKLNTIQTISDDDKTSTDY